MNRFYELLMPTFQDEKPRHGQEFQYRQEFGEQLVGKSHPIIVSLDIEKDHFAVHDSAVPKQWMPGQLVFYSRSTLVGIATTSKPFYLGLIYCSNRPGWDGVFAY